MMIWRLVLVALVSEGLELEPRKATHPFCLENKCETDFVSDDVIFCGKCDKYPTDLIKYSTLGKPAVILQDQVSRKTYTRLDKRFSYYLLGKRFGHWSDADTPKTSQIGTEILSKCHFKRQYNTQTNVRGTLTTQMNHMFYIPINVSPAHDRVTLTLGRIYNTPLSITYKPGQVLSKSSLKSFVSFKKAFLIINTQFDKSQSDIVQSTSPGFYDILPLAGVDKEDQELIKVQSHTFGFNPLGSLKFFVFCQGTAAVPSKKLDMEIFHSYKELKKGLTSDIVKWKQKLGQEGAKARLRDVMARTAAVANLKVRRARKEWVLQPISSECVPYAEGAIIKFSLGLQSV